jgi:hypothetical protein
MSQRQLVLLAANEKQPRNRTKETGFGVNIFNKGQTPKNI